MFHVALLTVPDVLISIFVHWLPQKPTFSFNGRPPAIELRNEISKLHNMLGAING